MYRWQGSTWKDAPRHMSSGNGRAGQWSIPAHLFQEPNPKHQTTPSAAKRVNQQKSPVGVDRKAKSRGTLEDRLAVSYQAKHSLTMQTINHAHRHSLEGTENSCPHTTCTWMFIAASFRLDDKSTGKHMVKMEHLNIVGGNVNWSNHCGQEYGESSKN